VIAMNSDKKVNGEQGVNVLLRDISKILFPNNPINVPVVKQTDSGAPLRLGFPFQQPAREWSRGDTSDIEGKTTRVGASECGQRTSFKCAL
jgi:hypothetical protein